MPHVLIVCTANICRSPVAEALLRERLSKLDGSEWQVSSAGTWASVGQPAARNGIELMAQQNIDLSGHRSRPVDHELLAEADLVLTMETGHAEALKAEFPQFASKIYLLTEMSDRHYSVPDPYGGPRMAYARMIGEVTDLIEAGLPQIVRLAKDNADEPGGKWIVR